MRRRFRCQTWQRWARARRVCSSVISGFFFPQAIRLFGEESRQDGAQGQVSDQRHVAAAFEVREAEFGFAHAEEVFDVPAGERDPQQSVQRCVGGGVRNEVFCFSGRRVVSHDQPVRSLGQFAVAHEMDLCGPHVPHLIGQRESREWHEIGRASCRERVSPRV